MSIAIEVKNLIKRFGDQTAVNNLNLTIQEGELFGLLGPNGSGKTTTIRMLTGLLSPTEGSISVMNNSHSPESVEYRRQLGVAFTGSLYERLSAKDNLAFFRSLYTDRDTHDPETVLKMVDLTDTDNKKVKVFSLGMRKRLDLARAIINKPKYLFLDEPTLGLDPIGARRLRKVVRDIADSGVTVFLTTHYMEEADALCDRVGFIDQGRLIALDSPLNLKSHHGQKGWQMLLKTNSKPIWKTIDEDDNTSIINALNDNTLYQLRKGEATLEDVFIRLTGKELDS